MSSEEALLVVCERMAKMQAADRLKAREIARAGLIPYPVEIFGKVKTW